MFEQLLEKGFDIDFQSHSKAILAFEFQEAASEIEATLSDISIPISEIVGSGGGETQTTQRLRRSFAERKWLKTNFEIRKEINGRAQSSISHEVDHVRTIGDESIALEIEWNNKDPFFDRDLENFKRLHVEGAIALGVIVTRGASLQAGMREQVRMFAEQRNLRSVEDLIDFGIAMTSRQRTNLARAVEQSSKSHRTFAETWAGVFCSDKFGESTTHWRKLEDRLRRRVGHPCPLLLVGIPIGVVTH